MRTEEVGAQQHRPLSLGVCRHTGADRTERCIPPQLGETDRCISDDLIADGETLKRPEPMIDRLLPQTGSAEYSDDAGRFRRDAQPGGIRLVQYRCAGAGVELRFYWLAVYLHSHDNLRVGVIDTLDLHFAGPAGRPVRQRNAIATLGLKEPERTICEIELDIDLVEEIVAENKGDVLTEIAFAGDYHAPTLARGLAD